MKLLAVNAWHCLSEISSKVWTWASRNMMERKWMKLMAGMTKNLLAKVVLLLIFIWMTHKFPSSVKILKYDSECLESVYYFSAAFAFHINFVGGTFLSWRCKCNEHDSCASLTIRHSTLFSDVPEERTINATLPFLTHLENMNIALINRFLGYCFAIIHNATE